MHFCHLFLFLVTSIVKEYYIAERDITVFTKDNEVELLKASMKGDTVAFEAIVKKYQSFICAITFSATGNVGTSEELAQETFISAWKSLSQLKDLSRFRSWLCAIARHIVRNSYRAKKRDIISKAVPLDDVQTAVSSDPQKGDEINENRQAVVSMALQQLPDKYREPLVLFYRQDQSIREVAKQLELSETAVRQRLSRGRKMLKDQVASIVESTLAQTGPDKQFTLAVIGSISALSIKGASASAAVIAATSSIASTGTTAILSTITAKVITAATVVAIAVTSTVAYKTIKNNNAAPEQPPIATANASPDVTQPVIVENMEIEQPLEKTANAVNSNQSTNANTLPGKIKLNDKQKSLQPGISTSKGQPQTYANNNQQGRLINVSVNDQLTGKPLQNAKIHTYKGKNTHSADENGNCRLYWDSTKSWLLEIWATSDGYVRMSYNVRPENTPGQDPVNVHFAMIKGTTIGGIIQDPDGNNLPGTDIKITVNHDEHMQEPGTNVNHSLKTDEDGRWHYDGVPTQLETLAISANHPDYASKRVWVKTDDDIQALRDKEYVLTIDAGYTITGTVKNEQGQPIKGARIQLGGYHASSGSKHRTHTDENGNYKFTSLDITTTSTTYENTEDQGRVSVRRKYEYATVSAHDYSPTITMAFFKEKQCNQDFTLTQGPPIFGRVIDTQGNPVPDAFIRAEDFFSTSIRSLSWTTRTDNEGRFVWLNAPTLKIKLDIVKDGYMTLPTPNITSSQDEYEFVLHQKLRINAQVIDAVTKEPVTKFTFRRHEGVSLSTKMTIEDQQGKFSTTCKYQSKSYTINIEAKGYQPTRSRKIMLDEQDAQVVIEMMPDNGIDGTVVDAQGNPLAGVRVIIPKYKLHFNNLTCDNATLLNHHHTLTDSAGHFHLDPVTSDKYYILIIEQAGYVFTHADDIPQDGKLTLQPYARITGDYYKAGKPAPNENIRLDYPFSHNGRNPISFNYNVQTDEKGRFVIDKLIGGTVRLLVGRYKELEIEPGETKEVYLGGDGLTITGNILNPNGAPLNEDFGHCMIYFQRTVDTLPVPHDEIPLPENADAMTYSQMKAWFNEFRQTEQGKQWRKGLEEKYGDLYAYYSVGIDSYGRFEVPNVKPGKYKLSVSVQPWIGTDPHTRRQDHNALLAQASTIFTVPNFESLEDMAIPVNLDTLQCRQAPLEVGMKAPAFEIRLLKTNGTIRLSDYLGKTVLINFIKPQPKKTEPEKTEILSQICSHAQASNDVAIINVIMETFPWDYMRQKLIKECSLPGTYALAQNYNSKIHADYELSRLPQSVLISPDGKIIFNGSVSEELIDILIQP